MSSPKLIFFGTPETAAHSLSELINNFNVIAVVTQPDKPVGRKQNVIEVPVKRVAKKFGIKTFQPIDIKTIIDDLKSLHADLGVVFAYSEIIPKKIINIFPRGILNIHPSLLPKYRGPAPVQAAIVNGEKETGVSIIVIDKNLDHGPILCQEKITIKADETARELLKKLAEKGTEILIHFIPKYISGELKPKPQDHAQATFTKIIKRDDGKIDWNMQAIAIYRQFRAYYPWPGIFTYINNKRVKILDICVMDNPPYNKQIHGKFFLTNKNELAVYCKKSALVLKKIQIEGKNPVDGKNFLLGHPEIINKKNS